jgi:hypothetical protein
MDDSVFKSSVAEAVANEATPQPLPAFNADAESGEEQPIALAETITGEADPSLEAYHNDSGEPYSQAYFELGTPYEYLPEHIKSDMSAIDEYVEMEIQDKHWKSSLSNYHRVIEGLAAELDVRSDELSTTEVIERIGAYAQSMLKLRGVDEVRDQLKKQLRRVRSRREANDLVLKTIGKRIL